eukprot:1605932-Pyramimonas_sp.AAC.1
MRQRHIFRHNPHSVRGPIGNSTESSSGRVRMRQRPQFRHTPHTVRGPIGNSTEGSKAGSPC